jgi:hypothetical protein
MAVCMCRIVRTVGVYFLGLAAPLFVSASAPLRTTLELPAKTVAASLQTYNTLIAIAAGPGSGSEASRMLQPQLTTPINSVGHRFTRRIFVEGTTFPSSDVLNAAWLQVPMRPQTPPQPAPQVRRNTFASPSSRQRAP